MRKHVVAAGLAVVLAAGAAGCEKDTAGGRTESGDVAYPAKTLQLMVPAAPGGGWDLTARTMQKALTDAKLAGGEAVEVYNVTGAAGTIGLAQLVSKNAGDAHHLMVMGLVMVGGVVANKSPVTLDQVTPIATLTAEQEIVVVPASSKYRTLRQLLDDAKADPASISWGGGSAGGTDQILVGLLGKAAGADPAAMKYVAYSGGGEAKAALLSGDLTAAVSGQSEFKDLVASGKVRALAVSGATGVDVGAGAPATTIKEQGYDVELMNWRGVVAPPGLDAPTEKAVASFVDKLHSSPQWQTALQQQGWEDFYRSGDEAKAYFKSENQRITTVLTEIGLG
ncbi:Bug family tripartite tricarboxylate transporter substrate binding protein [Actinoplanes sp. RD1]|uniref:Bug family tripartite tricarboxylate transporter substrate binding protein n=1 Tax=Actinoplanes sp. RD1 TaxID=3064538 RepID=UPI00274219C8|nr:tripartite tricarboxylate transporter substrate binding protein [Actinoplanes sp. RD1]